MSIFFTVGIPRISAVFVLLAGCLLSPLLKAEQVSIAVTGNFDFTAEELKKEFELLTDHEVILTPGTSSQLFGRILQGESFDIFLSDEAQRTAILEEDGKVISGSRFTYALGRLVLWSVNTRSLGPNVLMEKDFELLALSNPRLSPYGRAAEEFLTKLNLWDELQDRIVMGPNIGQTYHFAISGDVDMALIPFSQIIYGNYMQAGSYWPVPEQYYSPIEQQAVLLKESPAAREFIAFMQSNAGSQIITGNGFNIPR